MPNPYFKFKHFTVFHDRTAMKVTTDACLFGAWCAEDIRLSKQEQKDANDGKEVIQLLDIGVGTGLLSLMIAQKNNCMIDAVEIEKNAAEQAIENVKASAWKEKIKVYQQNILEFKDKQYPVIVSNPPFYETELQSANDKKNEAHHGTSLKLSDLFSYLKNQLTADGSFYLLLPFKRIKEAEGILKKENLFIQQKIIVSASPLHSPSRVMIKGRLASGTIEEKFLAITDEQQNYSTEFVNLLKDYYLYL